MLDNLIGWGFNHNIGRHGYIVDHGLIFVKSDFSLPNLTQATNDHDLIMSLPDLKLIKFCKKKTDQMSALPFKELNLNNLNN